VRLILLTAALAVTGCATKPAGAPITPEQHAANIAAAQQAGYKIVPRGDHTVFCPQLSATGSHMAPICVTESDFAAQLGGQRAGITPAAHVTNQSPGPGTGAGH
jgi:hypothetical protein